jgi:hypothetical protein
MDLSTRYLGLDLNLVIALPPRPGCRIVDARIKGRQRL